jgi:hypothetical protein
MPQNKLKRDEHSGNNNQLSGFPGYRTRQGRSGYDPLDTNREAAFMEGTFYRNLFTFRLRTRNPFYLVLMFVLGAATSVFMSIAFYAIISSPIYGERDFEFYLTFAILYSIFAIVLMVGLALFVNSLINFAIILGFGKNNHQSNERNVRKKKDPKKKLPKRRKDYR